MFLKSGAAMASDSCSRQRQRSRQRGDRTMGRSVQGRAGVSIGDPTVSYQLKFCSSLAHIFHKFTPSLYTLDDIHTQGS